MENNIPVTYEIWHIPLVGKRICYKEGLDEQAARQLAKFYGFAPAAFEKLVQHKSTRHAFLKKKPSEWWLQEIQITKNIAKQQNVTS